MTGGLNHSDGDIVGGRYQVQSYIGAGGMQEVYLAHDNLLGRAVALKSPKNSSAEKRFKRSAVVSARINHANVAKTLDYLEDSGRAYLVEEFIDGKDLSRLLKEHVGSFDPMLAGLVFHRLAKGLAASHHAGVIHRDLKPSNVMSVGGIAVSDVKVTDFGIAKMAEGELAEAIEGPEGSMTASQTAIGALPYMAPEMIRSLAAAGKAADIWSVGAMMFEILSGRKPFGTGLKAVPAILEGKLPTTLPLSNKHAQFKLIADEVFAIISVCLNVDPLKRPDADSLVRKCEQLCYPIVPRETGTISTFDNGYWGFIQPDHGKSIFFHTESVFGSGVKRGDRVLFSRHAGGGSDRAFPVLKLK